jgi:hypothetical protein
MESERFPNRAIEAEGIVVNIDINVARKVLEIVDAGLVRGVGNPKAGQMCVEAAVCYALGLPHGDDPQCVSRALRSLKIRLNDSKWSTNQVRAKGLRRLALIQLGSRDALDDREFAKRVAKLAIQLSVPIALRAVASIHKDHAHVKALRDAANECEREGTRQAAFDAKEVVSKARYAAAYAAYASYAAAYAAYASAASAASDAASAASAAAYASAASEASDAASAASAAAYASAASASAASAASDKSLSDFAEGVVQILISMNVPGVQWLPLTEVGS